MSFLRFELYAALTSLALSMVQFLIGSVVLFLLQHFLRARFFCLTSLESEEPDESDEEEDENFGSRLESGSFGTFVTVLSRLLSGL